MNDNIYQELGVSGLRQFNGIIDEEPLQQLKGPNAFKIYKEMSDNDPVIGALLFAIEMLIRQVSWHVEVSSDDADSLYAKELVETSLDDMSIPFKEVISEALSFLVFGYSLHEIVYKVRDKDNSKYPDKLIGWAKLPSRAQDTITKWVFSDGDIAGVYQQSPLNFSIVFIPYEKLLHFRTTSKKNNPEGRSILRNAYRPWFFKRRIEAIEAVGVERDLAGLPVMYVPSVYLDAKAPDEVRRTTEEFKKILRNIRRDEQEGLLLPLAFDQNGNQMFKIELLSSGGKRNFDTSQIINRYKQEIAMTVLADFILLGHEKVGSFALSSSKTELFALAIGAWLDTIADVFNNYAIPRLIKLNPLSPKDFPRLVHGDIESIDLNELSAFITALTSAGAQLFPDDELENYLRKQAGLPEKQIG